ncbi:MAG: hypothetical protein HFJ29_09620 [Clostridia bacterium]|nr:hypothetical protein [Clostridia bacterium]
MKARLTERDIKLIYFLGRYKQIKAIEYKKIYKSKDYYLKRLKALEKAKYIKREKRYIKTDIEGRKLLKELGVKNYNLCRNKDYQERIKEIIKIATLALEDEIEFIPSWELKESEVYTNLGRKYIGELKYMNRKYITYYISSKNNSVYAKQVVTDIERMFTYKNVIVFWENFNLINKRNGYFMIGDKSVIIINPTEENLKVMQILNDIDIYDVVQEVYKGKEVLLSNWDKADYVTDDKQYIISMPFIDTAKVHKLNIAYKDNKETSRKIDILTLKENKKKIDEILVKKTNIIEIDDIIVKVKNDEMSVYELN